MCGEAIASLIAGGVIVGGGVVALLLMSAHNHPDKPLPPLK
jgi:hypothetical protein